MTPMLNQKGFVDLTGVEKPFEVDIYLCGSAKFYLGCESEYYSLAYNFGVPCCEPMRTDYLGSRPNNFSQYLIFEDSQSSLKYTFSDIAELGLESIFSSLYKKNKSIVPCEINSEQNVNFVKEILDYHEGGTIRGENEALATRKAEFNILGGLCSQSLQLLT